MKPRKIILTTCVVVVTLVVITAIGFEKDHRSPRQNLNQYQAIRELTSYKIFGYELHSSSSLAVYDMSGRQQDDLPDPIGSVTYQVRKFGEVVEGDDQFCLGEGNYDQDGCMDYIYWTLASSPTPQHRLDSLTVFYRDLEGYPLSASLKEDLLDDEIEEVKNTMRRILGH